MISCGSWNVSCFLRLAEQGSPPKSPASCQCLFQGLLLPCFSLANSSLANPNLLCFAPTITQETMMGPGAASGGIRGVLLHVAVSWNGDSLITQREPLTKESVSQKTTHSAPPLLVELTHPTGDKRKLKPAWSASPLMCHKTPVYFTQKEG